MTCKHAPIPDDVTPGGRPDPGKGLVSAPGAEALMSAGSTAPSSDVFALRKDWDNRVRIASLPAKDPRFGQPGRGVTRPRHNER